MSMTTGCPGGEGGAVTVTRIEAESSPFSFCAKTLVTKARLTPLKSNPVIMMMMNPR